LTGNRIHALDAVRGMAVMGILLMNIVALGMPSYAYLNPTYYGLNGPADWAAWTINYIVSEGKFRALFTMLFGASMVVIAERAEANRDGPGPAMTHYRRMFWLFIIGMIHAWCFWYGDILVQYAIGGTLGFLFWRWQPRALWLFFATMLTLQTASYLGPYAELAPVRAAAMATNATTSVVAKWEARKTQDQPTQADAAAELQGYRGDIKSVFETRAKTTIFFQTILTPVTMPEIFAFMTLGILLFRNGFLTGGWSSRSYALVIGAGYLLAVPLMAALASTLRGTNFDPAIQALCDSGSLLLRPFIASAHAAVIIMLVRSGSSARLTSRLEAIGRMALSNYLGTTLIATTLWLWLVRLSRAGAALRRCCRDLDGHAALVEAVAGAISLWAGRMALAQSCALGTAAVPSLMISLLRMIIIAAT
jgi:uncharacterized protein